MSNSERSRIEPNARAPKIGMQNVKWLQDSNTLVGVLESLKSSRHVYVDTKAVKPVFKLLLGIVLGVTEHNY